MKRSPRPNLAWHEATRLEAFVAATRRAARGKAELPEVARFLMDTESACLELQQVLRLPVDHPDAWWPAPTRSFRIHDPKPRTITVAPFPDRVVHHVLCAVLEPRFERYAIHHTYACRRGKGQQKALRQCQRFARSEPWVLKADITSYFASIPHDRLLDLVRRRVQDRDVCDRVERALAGSRPGIWATRGRGLPIGALTSQHLANLYLGLLDHWLTDDLGFGRTMRYMDDFLVFGNRSELRSLLPRLRQFLTDRLGLRLNEHHSRIQPVRDGIPFLGLRVFPSLIRVSADRWRRFRARERELEREFARGDIGEEAFAEALTSLYSHLEAFDTYELRREYRRRYEASRGRGRASLQPGEPRRLLEEQPAERARGEPQQGRALQAQRQPGVSRSELDTTGSRGARGAGPVGSASRSAPLCPGIDQTSIPCSGKALRSGTEPPRPGGGASRVAAGLFSPGNHVDSR